MDRFVVFPEAREKLRSSGLQDRIDLVIKNNQFSHLGFVSFRDIPGLTKELQTEGFLKTLPDEEKKHFMTSLQKIFQERDSTHWQIFREDGPELVNLEPEDFYVLTGFMSTYVMRPEEIWDYKKFGFDSIFEFVGTLGAAMLSDRNEDPYDKGYKWEHRRSDRIFRNNITGTSHLDLLIERKEDTPHRTIDPLGNEVHYRPRTRKDLQYLGAYHSTERELLVTLLRYIEQLNLKIPELKDDAKHFIEWTRKLGQIKGNAADAGCDIGISSDPATWFVNGLSLPTLNENFEASTHSNYGVSAQKGAFMAYVGSEKELVFSYVGRSGIDAKVRRKPSISFYPEEAQHLIKGVFVQASNGLGRTSVSQLRRVMEFRFSEEYDKYIEEYGIRL